MPPFFRPSATAFFLAVSGALTLSATPARAAENSFSIPPQATTLQGNAIGGGTVILPGTGSPGFVFSFILPRDYAKNKKISVVLYLNAADSACITRIVTTELDIIRRGSAISDDISGVDDGNPNIKIGDKLVSQKVVTIGPGTQLDGQRPGDAMRLQFRREPDDDADTCVGSVFVQAIDIRYPIRGTR